jgi:hypothetical protein
MAIVGLHGAPGSCPGCSQFRSGDYRHSSSRRHSRPNPRPRDTYRSDKVCCLVLKGSQLGHGELNRCDIPMSDDLVDNTHRTGVCRQSS